MLFFACCNLLSCSDGNSIFCRREKYAINETIEGYVVDFYEDSNNHNIRTVEIKRNKKVFKSTIFLHDQSGLYETLEIGNYLKKEKGDLNIFISNDSTSLQVKLEFNCNKTK